MAWSLLRALALRRRRRHGQSSGVAEGQEGMVGRCMDGAARPRALGLREPQELLQMFPAKKLANLYHFPSCKSSYISKIAMVEAHIFVDLDDK